MDHDHGSSRKVFRKRDFAFLVVLILSIYISLDTTSFTYRLQPSWYFDQRAAGLSSEAWPQLAPLIVDLDGDDRKEIVFITKDQFLKVIRAEPPAELTEDIYAPLEIASTPLSNALGKVIVADTRFRNRFIEPWSNPHCSLPYTRVEIR
jgi:hypothetical protein